MRKQGLIAAMLILAVWGSSLPSRFSKPPSRKHQGASASGDRIWSLKALGDLLAKEEPRQLAAGARDESLVSSWCSAHGAPSPNLFPLPLWSEGLPIEGRKPEKTPALTEHRAAEASASESGSFLLARLHLSDAEALIKRMESLACSLGGPASTSASSLSTGGGLAGAKSGLEGPRLHREALSAFSSGDWVSFRERAEELALLPSTQDASLYLEHLDGLGALISGRVER